MLELALAEIDYQILVDVKITSFIAIFYAMDSFFSYQAIEHRLKTCFYNVYLNIILYD